MLDCFSRRREVLAAVAQNGEVLGNVYAELRGGREVVLAQTPWVLKYASVELNWDEEVVLAAVAQNGRVLK
jgi:hypothetical protein